MKSYIPNSAEFVGRVLNLRPNETILTKLLILLTVGFRQLLELFVRWDKKRVAITRRGAESSLRRNQDVLDH